MSYFDKDLFIASSSKIVTQASDLSGTLDSTIAYFIDGVIAMGSQTITVPSGGLTIHGLGPNISCLSTSQTAYTMFIDGGTAGPVHLEGLEIKCTGATSKIFDLNNSGGGGTFAMIDCDLTNAVEVGYIDAYGDMNIEDCEWTGCSNGMTLYGTWSGGVRIENLEVENFGASGTVFLGDSSLVAGVTLVIGSRFISNATMTLPSGAVGYNFSAANFTNDGAYELLNGEYKGSSTTVTATTARTSVKSNWRGNIGLENTYVGSRWQIASGDEAATTCSVSDTYYKVAGTTTYADEQWFSNTTDNAFVYDSSNTIEAIIQGNLAVTAGNNETVQFVVRHYDASAAAYGANLYETSTLLMVASGTDPQHTNVLAFAELDAGDRIELWVKNVAHTTAVTVKDYSVLAISQRAN